MNGIWCQVIRVLEGSNANSWVSWRALKINEDDQATHLSELHEINQSTVALGHEFAYVLHLNEETKDTKESNDFHKGGLITSKEEIHQIDDGENDQDENVTCTQMEYLKSIQLTKDVVKWLKKCGSVYRGFFHRRIKQPAHGHRSRKLAKQLLDVKLISERCTLNKSLDSGYCGLYCRTRI